jgi:hypothetical protein
MTDYSRLRTENTAVRFSGARIEVNLVPQPSYCVGLLLLLFSSPVVARDIFVDNATGDDAANGRAAEQSTLGGPVRTIARALELLTNGDRLTLADNDEPYCEPICLSGPRHRGTQRHPLVIDGGGAVLDGTVMAQYGAWRHVRGDVFAMRPQRLTYQRLFRDGKPLKRAALVSWNGRGPQLEPLEWTLAQGHIYLRVEEDHLPNDYSLRHTGLQTGISLYNTDYVRIENLIVQGFQQDGINAHDTVRHAEIVDVECRANGRSGISVGGASRVRIELATCYDNGQSQLRVEGVAKVELENCDLDEQSTMPLDIQGGAVTIDGAVYVQ